MVLQESVNDFPSFYSDSGFSLTKNYANYFFFDKTLVLFPTLFYGTYLSIFLYIDFFTTFFSLCL